MGRMYTVQFNDVAVTVAVDFFDLAPAAESPIIIHAIFISQNTEVGDAAEEMLTVRVIRGFATVGSGGAAATPVQANENDAGALFTARTNDTTIAVVGAGATEIFHSEAFNVRTGWVYIPTPEMRPICTLTKTRIVVQLKSAPADSVTFSGTCYVEEI